MTDADWMREALALAQKALSLGELPVGAVAVEDGVVLGRGYNQRERTGDPTAHAEVLALREAGLTKGDWRLNRVTLYVTLEPCPMCAGAISLARLHRLVYGAGDPARGCAGSVYRIPEDPALGWFCQCDGGVLEEECAQLLQTFFRARRR